MIWIGVGVALVALLCIGVLLYRSGRHRLAATGLPAGTVVYSDTDQWKALEKPLVSRRYGLVGRPDYLVEVTEKRRQVVIPVEVKSRRRPPQPYDSHILQLATYCLLVEDQLKTRPPYGLLHYADSTLSIPFTDELRFAVLGIAASIRAARTAAQIHRQHVDAGRCRGCGYRLPCGEEAL